MSNSGLDSQPTYLNQNSRYVRGIFGALRCCVEQCCQENSVWCCLEKKGRRHGGSIRMDDVFVMSVCLYNFLHYFRFSVNAEVIYDSLLFVINKKNLINILIDRVNKYLKLFHL